MTYIALEEAFWMDGLQTDGSFTDQKSTVMRPEVLEGLRKKLTDFTEMRLPDMDEYGIDVQVLSLTAPGIQIQPDPAVATADAAKANDFLADVIARHPKRFAGFAALALQDPVGAAAELGRCVEQLGFVGALVNDHTLGHYLDEPQFEPVWAELERLDVPLYLHPGTPGDFGLLSGRPALSGPLWSWQATTGGHTMRLVLGGVFDRHPGAKLVIGHMGEFLPFQLTRFDTRARDVQRELTSIRPPSDYFRTNIFATTTGVFSHPVLRAAIETMGAERILFSIDYPYESTASSVAFLDSAPLAADERAKISRLNARGLLRLPE